MSQTRHEACFRSSSSSCCCTNTRTAVPGLALYATSALASCIWKRTAATTGPHPHTIASREHRRRPARVCCPSMPPLARQLAGTPSHTSGCTQCSCISVRHATVRQSPTLQPGNMGLVLRGKGTPRLAEESWPHHTRVWRHAASTPASQQCCAGLELAHPDCACRLHNRLERSAAPSAEESPPP